MTRPSRCAAASGNRVRPFGWEASRSTSSTVCIHARRRGRGEIHPNVELQRSIHWASEQHFELAVDAVAGEHHAERSCDAVGDVVSLSLGWPGLHEEWAAPIQALLDAGVVVVAAVGNEFTSAGVPKTRSPANFLTEPRDAADGILIAVGAHDRTGAIWDDSGGGQIDWANVKVGQTDGSTRPSIFATMPPRIVPALVGPGVDIVSATPGDKYFATAGSSMATPHIAGLLALVLCGLRTHDPSTRPRAAADLVLANLTDVPPVGIDIRSGGGRVGLDRLLDALAATK